MQPYLGQSQTERTHFEVLPEEAHVWIRLQVLVLLPPRVQILLSSFLLGFLRRALPDPVQDLPEMFKKTTSDFWTL